MNKLYNYNQEYIVSHIKKLLNKTKLSFENTFEPVKEELSI